MRRNLSHGDEMEMEHLTCPDVTCGEHVRLFERRVTHVDDQPVVGAAQGPYLIPIGKDFDFLQAGKMYLLYEENSRLRARPFQLVHCENPHGDDEYLIPDFGYVAGKVLWVCKVTNSILGSSEDSLIFLAMDAARREKER